MVADEVVEEGSRIGTSSKFRSAKKGHVETGGQEATEGYGPHWSSIVGQVGCLVGFEAGNGCGSPIRAIVTAQPAPRVLNNSQRPAAQRLVTAPEAGTLN